MKSVSLIVVALVVGVGQLAAAAAADARSPVLLASCSVLDLEFEPSQWSPGCAGGSPFLEGLEWHGWGTPTASSTGQVLLNDCEPSCAEGGVYRYPAQVTADRIRRCHEGGRTHRQYTRVRLSWNLPDGNPFGEPAGWHEFGPLRVSSSDCRRVDEPLHPSRPQAHEIAEAAVNRALTRKDWDVYSEGSVTRASACRHHGGRRFSCHVFARASDLEHYAWWRGTMQIGIGARKASWRWSGRRRKCFDVFRCRPVPFNWHGTIDADSVGLFISMAGPTADRQPTLDFGGYGPARTGDTPGQVRQALGEPVECHYLAGSCVCATLGDYPSIVVFVFRLDRRAGLDLIFTSSREVVVSRGLRVGDSVGRMRSLYPHTHKTSDGPYGRYKRFLVSRGPLGILAETRRGRITGFIVGKKRFFDYEEFCA
jgi:hypothetical protein